MEQRPTITILEWIMKQIEKRDGGLRALTADEAADLIRNDPELTEAQQDVLLSRDPLRIRAVIEYELGYKLDEYMMHTTPFYFVLPIPMHL